MTTIFFENAYNISFLKKLKDAKNETA